MSHASKSDFTFHSQDAKVCAEVASQIVVTTTFLNSINAWFEPWDQCYFEALWIQSAAPKLHVVYLLKEQTESIDLPKYMQVINTKFSFEMNQLVVHHLCMYHIHEVHEWLCFGKLTNMSNIHKKSTSKQQREGYKDH